MTLYQQGVLSDVEISRFRYTPLEMTFRNGVLFPLLSLLGKVA